MASEPYKVLLIGESAGCARLLRDQPVELKSADHLADGLRELAARRFDALLLDLTLPGCPGPEAFAKVHAAAIHLPIIVLARVEDEELAARTLTLGAQDYLLQRELTGQLLARAIRNAIYRGQAQDAHGRGGPLLHTLMENIPDAIYFKDTESRFLTINRATAKRFGLSDPAQAVGKTDADFFSEAHAQQALADEQQVIHTGRPLVGIEEMETWPDGGVTWVSTTKMPLRDKSGRIIGTFGISRDITRRKLAQQALAERTWQLEQKKQQIEEELKMARELQVAMLPQQFPCVGRNPATGESALEFFSFYAPTAAVSGDFFDVMSLSETTVGVFICDVMGHDVRAALITAMMRAQVEDLSGTITDPGQLLTQLNETLVNVFKQTGSTVYATAFYMVADIARGEVLFANGAHPEPLHLRPGQGKVDLLRASTGGKKGPALGLFPAAAFPTCRCQIAPGDLITLFTDGLIEAEGLNQETFTQQRLAAAILQRRQLPPNRLLAELIAEIRQFCGRQEFDDDICLLGVQVKRLEPGAS